MKKQSAGLLLFKRTKKGVEVLIGHPGGPFWAKRSQGSWSIPKGEITTDEDMFTAAKREFAEELGAPAPEGDYISLGDAKQPSGKVVYIWAYEADFDASHIASNLFEMEWPPKSGQTQQFPELDKAGWFTLAEAQTKLVKGQLPFIDRLAAHLQVEISGAEDAPQEEQTSLF